MKPLLRALPMKIQAQIKNCLFDGKLRTDGFIGNSYVPKDYAIAKGGTIKNCYYYHSEPRFGGATYNGELYKDGDKFTVISKTQKVMGTGRSDLAVK